MIPFLPQHINSEHRVLLSRFGCAAIADLAGSLRALRALCKALSTDEVGSPDIGSTMVNGRAGGQSSTSAPRVQTHRALLFASYTAIDRLVGDSADQTSAEHELRAAFSEWPMLCGEATPVHDGGITTGRSRGGGHAGDQPDVEGSRPQEVFTFMTSDQAICYCPQMAAALGMVDPLEIFPEMEDFFFKRFERLS